MVFIATPCMYAFIQLLFGMKMVVLKYFLHNSFIPVFSKSTDSLQNKPLHSLIESSTQKTKMQKVIAMITCYIVILPIAILKQETNEAKIVVEQEVENEDTKAGNKVSLQYQKTMMTPQQISKVLTIFRDADRLQRLEDKKRKFEEAFDEAFKQLEDDLVKFLNENEELDNFFQRNIKAYPRVLIQSIVIVTAIVAEFFEKSWTQNIENDGNYDADDEMDEEIDCY